MPEAPDGGIRRLVLADVLGGFAAGSAALAVGLPFDVVKVRCQTQPHLWRGPWNCARQTLQREGPMAFYRGAAPASVIFMLESTVVLSMERQWRRCLNRARGRPSDGPLSAVEESVCGGVSGICAVTLMCPLEVIQVRLQNLSSPCSGSSSAALRRLADTTLGLWRCEGVRGFYRGYAAHLLRDTPTYSIFFSTYEMYVRRVQRRNGALRREDLSWLHVMNGGGLANALACTVVLPIDTAKTVAQSGITLHDGVPQSCNRASSGTLATCLALYRADGLRRLLRGGLPLFLSSYAQGAVWWLTVELIQGALKHRWEAHADSHHGFASQYNV